MLADPKFCAETSEGTRTYPERSGTSAPMSRDTRRDTGYVPHMCLLTRSKARNRAGTLTFAKCASERFVLETRTDRIETPLRHSAPDTPRTMQT